MQLWHCECSLMLLLTICRCLKDNTVNYNYTLSSVQRFSLKTFNFRLLKSDEVYLHCQVTACLRSDLSSRCAQGCPYGRRRKRNKENEMEQYLAIGPIIVSTKDSDVHEKTGTSYSGGSWGSIRVIKIPFPCLTRYMILLDLSSPLSPLQTFLEVLLFCNHFILVDS